MIDEISFQILQILQEKARIPNVEVARQVGLAPSAVLERIRKLEKSGIIDGYEVKLNPEHFAQSLVAFIYIELTLPEQAGIAETLNDLDEVQEIHYLSGKDGFFIKVRVASPKALKEMIQQKIHTIPGVKSTRSQVVLSTFKETSKISLNTVYERPCTKQ